MAVEYLMRVGEQLADRRAVAGERIEVTADLAGGPGDLAPSIAEVVEHALHNDEQGRRMDRLGEAILGAELDRLHREIDRRVTGPHQDRHSLVDIVPELDQIQAI